MRNMQSFGMWVVVASVSLWGAGCGSSDSKPEAGSDAKTPSNSTPAAEKDSAGAGDAVKGKAAFAASCTACHTPDGGAITGLGKDIVNGEFTASISDDELVAFITNGRDAGDPLNTTGIPMPPKGGDPSLTDQKLRDIVAFIRARQAEEGVELK